MRPVPSLIVLVVILAVFYYFAQSRAPDMLANKLSNKLGVAVSIDSIKPRLSTISINMLEIANAPGYTLPKAFSAKTIELHAPLKTYFEDSVVVEQIDIDTIYLGIEFDTTSSGQGNWTHLLSLYKKGPNLDPNDKRQVLIKKIVFTNIHSDLMFHSEGNQITKLPLIARMVLTDVSSHGGLPIDQLTSSILGQMLIQAFQQYHLNNMLEGIVDTPGKAVETILKPFGEVFNTAPKERIQFQEYANSHVSI